MIRFLRWIIIFLEVLSFRGAEVLEIETFDEITFEQSIQNIEKYDLDGIKSMIVPHHLLASDLIANMYSTASSDAVECILLISPDHYTNSGRKALISKKSWTGPFGRVDSDHVLVEKLLEFDFIYEDDEEIEIEHGINSHIPYIAKYFKNAKVIPLAVTKEITEKQLIDVINLLDEEIMVIASVDFSHYLSLEEANESDEKTRNIIKRKDYDMFFGLDDGYFDSAGSLFLVFNHAKKMGYETYILDHSNSAYYLSENIPETTSYFIIGFK